jgi:hypothetical protein
MLHHKAAGAALAHSRGRAALRRLSSDEHCLLGNDIAVAQAGRDTDRVVRGMFYRRHNVRRCIDVGERCSLTSAPGGPAPASSRHVLFDIR